MNVLLLSEMNVILYTEAKIDNCKCCRMMMMMKMLLLLMIMTKMILSLNNYVTYLLQNIICICETSPLWFVTAMLLKCIKTKMGGILLLNKVNGCSR